MSVLHRILVAYDGSQDSRGVLVACDQNARLTLLTVVPDVRSSATSVAVGPCDLESHYSALQRGGQDAVPDEVPVTTILRHGPPAHHIAAVAEGHDLVVMGTHGRGSLGDSVSREVVRSIRGAVVLARAPAPAAAAPEGTRPVSAADAP